MRSTLARPLYQAYYCEENIWHLAQAWLREEGPRPAYVCFISNPSRSSALWFQKAALDAHTPVVWDYHVILLGEREGRWEAWDLDCTLGAPLALDDYLRLTFSGAEQWPERFRPQFRVVEAGAFVEALCSDRSHMLDEAGGYLQPPPPWPPPHRAEEAINLMQFVDVQRPFLGDLYDLQSLIPGIARRTG